MAPPTDVNPRRPTLFFIVVLSLLFILMSSSSRTLYVGETRTLFERAVMSVFAPVPRTVNWIGDAASDAYHGYLDMRRAVAENVDLRREVAGLTVENLRLRRSGSDLQRLRSLLDYSEGISLRTTLAQTIMVDTSSRFKSIIIDRGSRDGVQVNDAIANAGGLIGRVVLTTNDMAKVQLITDANCAVGCLIERTRRQGVLHGDGAGGAQLFGIPTLADVHAGDEVLTAGIDGIYPKGIQVGIIDRAEKGQDLFKTLHVRPAVDFGSVEEVIVIHTRPIPQQVVEYAP